MRRVDPWEIFEFYRRIPVWFRLSLACIVCGAGIFTCLKSHKEFTHWRSEMIRLNKPADPLVERGKRGPFMFGLYITFGGIVLLALSGRSQSEQNGYNF